MFGFLTKTIKSTRRKETCRESHLFVSKGDQSAGRVVTDLEDGMESLANAVLIAPTVTIERRELGFIGDQTRDALLLGLILDAIVLRHKR